MRRLMLPALLAGLLAVASTASADPSADLSTITAATLAEQRAQVEADLRTEDYDSISRQDRATVQGSFDRMAALLAPVASVADLSEADRVALFNEQEKINTALVRAREDSRVVCEHSRATGSHRRTTNCATVAERRLRRQRDVESHSRVTRPTGLPRETDG